MIFNFATFIIHKKFWKYFKEFFENFEPWKVKKTFRVYSLQNYKPFL